LHDRLLGMCFWRGIFFQYFEIVAKVDFCDFSQVERMPTDYADKYGSKKTVHFGNTHLFEGDLNSVDFGFKQAFMIRAIRVIRGCLFSV